MVKPVDDPPIVEREFVVPQVIDLGDVRVARGLSRRPHKLCPHNRLTYDSAERRVWCAECESTLDGFDAFMVLTNNFLHMLAHARSATKEAEEARAAVIHRIAAKKLEKTWRGGYAAVCPHCRSGLLPEDITTDALSRELEIARRKRAPTEAPTG